ncbi:uncharacterized protein EDB91DRAFT_1146844 [Suillus paluster]|uniref:uncharacterized protein n=1 Tax=Suillus paluster TaxID=48578 RepID=UPI001B865D25|nr:uncharacterized protein EDB91DRAFT_1146844 [Suillus paluster]KAG1734405.1 hypothetical protein EDB91DRAFT_1146844 [Suillus paluster]
MAIAVCFVVTKPLLAHDSTESGRQIHRKTGIWPHCNNLVPSTKYCPIRSEPAGVQCSPRKRDQTGLLGQERDSHNMESYKEHDTYGVLNTSPFFNLSDPMSG